MFLNQHGRPITTRGMQMVLDRICQAAAALRYKKTNLSGDLLQAVFLQPGNPLKFTLKF